MDPFDHNIDRLFKEGATDFQAAPPSTGWDGLAAGLDRRQKRKKFFWLQMAAAFALLVTAFGGGYYLGQQPENTNLNIPILPVTPVETQSKIQSNEPSITSEPESSASDPVESVVKPRNAGSTRESQASKNNSRIEPNNTAETPSSASTTQNQNRDVVREAAAITASSTPAKSTETNQAHSSEMGSASTESIASLDANRSDIEDNALNKEQGAIHDEEPTQEIASPFLQEAETVDAFSNYEYSAPDDILVTPAAWSIGLTAGPTSSFRVTEDVIYQPGNPNGSFNYSTEQDRPIQSWAANLGAHYQINRHWVFSSGIGYVRYGQEAGSEFTYTAPSSATGNVVSGQSSAGSIEVTDEGVNALIEEGSIVTSGSLGQISTHQYFDFIEVPLTATYLFGRGPFQVGIEAGIAGNFQFGNKVVFAEGNTETAVGTTANTESFLFTALGGLRLNYNLKSPIAFSITPQIRYGLESLSQTENFTPYSIGVQAGISYRL